MKGDKEGSPPTCCQQSFFGILLNGLILPFVLATFPKVSSPRDPRRRQRNQPACCGGAVFLFHNKTWTIIPTLGSLRVYVHPWSGKVSFLFLPCSRYPNSRKCVHTPLLDEESILANKHNPYTHLGAPLPAYPYKPRVGGSRSYEVPTTRSTLPKGKRCVCQVRFFFVGWVRPEMLCLHTRLPLFPKASRRLLYDDGRPPVGGLLHKAPAEEKLYPSEYKMLSSAQHRD